MPPRAVLSRVWASALVVVSALGLHWSGASADVTGAPRAGVVAHAPPRRSVQAASAGCGASARPGDTTIRVLVAGGQLRTARLHVPRAALGHPAPLLLAFHGSGATGRFMERYSGLTAPLDAAGAIGVFPDAAGGRWQLTGDVLGGDVAFVGDLLDAVEQRVCVDARRVWATGVSNGGGFTALLACELSERIAAVAVVAGGFASLSACRPARPVSVLEIHGTDDPVVPYAGRPQDGRRGAVRAWLAGWVRRDGCAREPRTRMLAARVALLTWNGCAAGTAVSHIRIAGGRHQWPGATPPDPGPRAGFSAAGEIWRFLAGRRLPA
ncbi:MAG TPA: hypothetical protein VGF63_13140 [Solirubrobacteraceae bacterium]